MSRELVRCSIVLVVLLPLFFASRVPSAPLWPTGFVAPNSIVAFDEVSVPHTHTSMFYYTYTNSSGKWIGKERHDHIGYCYGWNLQNCTILIIGNVYIIGDDLCCNALSGNYGVPRDWLKPAIWLGEEMIENQRVNHWYFAEHEYWSAVDAPYYGVRYSGPNFKTPRQFTNYQKWIVGPQPDSLFELPKGRNCEQVCPSSLQINF